jgi:hypothetical protein
VWVGRGAHVVVAMNVHLRDAAETPGVDELPFRFDNVRSAAALRSHLNHALVLSSGGQHGLAFRHVHADGLLAIDIGAGFGGFDHGECVPVIGRRDQADIQSALFQHVAIVVKGLRLPSRFLPRCNDIGRLRKHDRIHVTERHDLHRLNLNEAEQIDLSIPAGPDETHAPRPARGLHGASAGSGGGKSGGGLKKAPAVHARSICPRVPGYKFPAPA